MFSINCSIRSKVAHGYNLDVGTHAPNSKHNLKLSEHNLELTEHNLKQSNTISSCLHNRMKVSNNTIWFMNNINWWLILNRITLHIGEFQLYFRKNKKHSGVCNFVGSNSYEANWTSDREWHLKVFAIDISLTIHSSAKR